jgi:hypothetical protein
MKTTAALVCIALLALFLASCAPGVNEQVHMPTRRES